MARLPRPPLPGKPASLPGGLVGQASVRGPSMTTTASARRRKLTQNGGLQRRALRRKLFGDDFDIRKATPEQLKTLETSGSGMFGGGALLRPSAARRRPARRKARGYSGFGNVPSGGQVSS